MWQPDLLSGSKKLLSELVDAEGAPFPGIDASGGTWIVALQCGSCWGAVPAPWFLTVLEPCSAAAP